MCKVNDQVLILMASYNGEKYIEEQIESILNQTYKNILLLISDDNSTDATQKIIRNYTKKYSNIKLIATEKVGGARLNFQRLITYALSKTDNAYIMFADQDDIWHSNKIELELKYIKQVEKENFNAPILVYSNYYDFKNRDVENAIKRYSVPPQNSFSRIVLQSWLMGCTMILNRRLLELCHTIPKEADNHDAWISMIASLVGVIGYIDEPTILHRIHQNNVTQQTDTTNTLNRIKRAFLRVKTRKEYRKKMQALLGCIKNTVKDIECNKELLIKLELLLEKKGLSAYRIIRENEFFGVDRIQNILFTIQFSVK